MGWTKLAHLGDGGTEVSGCVSADKDRRAGGHRQEGGKGKRAGRQRQGGGRGRGSEGEGKKQRAKGQGSEDEHGSRQTAERWR